MQLSSFIGKPVLSPSGDFYGYVTDARLTKDRSDLACLVCADGDEEEFYLPKRAVLSFGDALIAGRSRLPSPTGVPSPLGAEIYSGAGELLGNVADVLFGEGNGAFLVYGKESVRVTAPIACALFGARVILYPDPAAKPKSPARRASPPPYKKAPQKKREEGAAEGPSATPAPVPSSELSPEPSPDATTDPPLRPPLFNRTNLLGRTVQRSVFDRYGAAIVLAGERVTPSVIAAARRSNCLLQLALNTLTAYN